MSDSEMTGEVANMILRGKSDCDVVEVNSSERERTSYTAVTEYSEPYQVTEHSEQYHPSSEMDHHQTFDVITPTGKYTQRSK